MISARTLLILIIVHGFVGVLSTNADTNGTIANMEVVDLGLATTVNDSTDSFYRTAVFSDTWERMALNLTVHNLGDELDYIGVQVVLNGISTTASFSQYQSTLGLSRAIIYQFTTPQVLVVPLNHTPQSFYEIEITLTLDYGIQLLPPTIDLRILHTDVIGIRPVVSTEPVQIPILSSRHAYLVPGQTSTNTFSRTRLLVRLFLPIELDPTTEALYCNISVTMNGGQFKSVSIGDSTHSPETSVTSLTFEETLVFSAEALLYALEVLVLPETTTQEALTPVTISFHIRGYLIPRTDIFPPLVLPPHPIPVPVMLLVWIVVLFGIPIWYIYQENLATIPEEVLDGKTDQKV